MKTNTIRKIILIGNILNFLVGISFILVSVILLVKLRWYHQLTYAVQARQSLTSSTSYIAFFIPIIVGLLLAGAFLASLTQFREQVTVSFHEDQAGSVNQTNPKTQVEQVVVEEGVRKPSRIGFCGWILTHTIASLGLTAILFIWPMNSGELVRRSVSLQLEQALSKYQFTNRSNPFSIAVDGMQDINECCGSFEYTDFPHQRLSGLSSGNYPGSCCGKNVFGNNARVICTPEEIIFNRQTVSITDFSLWFNIHSSKLTKTKISSSR